MTSDQKTLVPSLLKYIDSDLFTFDNISSSVTLEADEPDILGNDISKWDVDVLMKDMARQTCGDL